MKQLFPRWARPEDSEWIIQWLERIREKNLLDPAVLTYPATRVMVAEDRDGRKPKLAVPVQKVLMLESLAPEPESEGQVEAMGLRACLFPLVVKAQEEGVGEIMFLCKDEQVIKYAEKYGFERVNIPLLRMRV